MKDFKETKVAIFDCDYYTEDERDYIKRCSDTEIILLLEDDTDTACSYTFDEYIEILNENPTAFNECFFRIYED